MVACRQINDPGGNPQGNGLHWFRNVNNGASWSAAIEIDSPPVQFHSTLVADVDGDGVLDVLAPAWDSNQVSWYENGRVPGSQNDNPAFTKNALGTPTRPEALATGNLDGDAARELIVVSDDGLRWYDPPGDPGLTWTANTIDAAFSADLRIASAAIADFNLDGRMDLALAFRDLAGNPAVLRWYERNGDGSWTARAIPGPPEGVNFVAAGDIDGDGRPDLVTSTYESTPDGDPVGWWRNQ